MLSEISREVLGRYKDRASKNLMKHNKIEDKLETRIDKHFTKKFSGRSLMYRPEDPTGEKLIDKQDRNNRIIFKRETGINRARSRLTKEDQDMTNSEVNEVELTEEEILEAAMNEFANFVEESEDFDSLEEALDAFCEQEQLDEISRKRLGDYLERSSVDSHNTALQYHNKRNPVLAARKHFEKRRKGQIKAIRNLTKEDFEPLFSALADEKPHEFTQSFNDMMKDRVANLIDQRKLELASDLFGAPEGLEESEVSESLSEEKVEEKTHLTEEEFTQLLDEGKITSVNDEHGETWHHQHMYRNRTHPDYQESKDKNGNHSWFSDSRIGKHVWVNHKTGNVAEPGHSGISGVSHSDPAHSGFELDTRKLYHTSHYSHSPVHQPKVND